MKDNKQFSFDKIIQPQFGFKYLEQDFDIWLQVILGNMNEVENKNQILKELLIKYFLERIGINIERQSFSQRPQDIQASKISLPIKNRFILYGVDFLSTQMIKDYFQPNKINIRWIDDSSCIIYAKQQLQLHHLIRSQDYQQIKKEKWLKLKSYYVFGMERMLFLRYATTNDDRLGKSKANSYGLYQYYRKSMPFYFLNKFNAVEAYEYYMSCWQREQLTNNIGQYDYQLKEYDLGNGQQQQIGNISITANIDDFEQMSQNSIIIQQQSKIGSLVNQQL